MRALWNCLRGSVWLVVALSNVTLLSSCGGDNGPSSYALNVYVSGLTGSGLLVTLNGGSPISIPGNSQTTVAHLANGTAYTIAINAQPINPAKICSATNPTGKISGNNVDVMINCPVPPTVTTQPQSASTLVGQSITFSVSATGAAPISYQWTLNGQSISGATSTTYQITNATAQQNGETYAVVVSNVAGRT